MDESRLISSWRGALTLCVLLSYGLTLTSQELLWKADIGSRESSPAIDADGNVYFLSGRVFSFRPDGTPIGQSFGTGNGESDAPTIAPDGTIYAGGSLSLWALTPTGGSIWQSSTAADVETSPALGADGTIYIATEGGYTGDSRVWAFNPEDGDVFWTITIGAPIYSSPVIGGDGTLYFAHLPHVKQKGESTLQFATHSGEVFDSVDVQGLAENSPAIGSDGTIYLGAQKLNAISPDGDIKWIFPDDSSLGRFSGSPSIGVDGTIYCGTADGDFYAINPDGSLKWSLHGLGYVGSSAAIGANGTIFFGADDGNLYAVSQDGRIRWTYEVAFPIRSSQTIGKDGTVYFSEGTKGLGGNFVYAIKTDAGGLAKSAWPKFRADQENTGRYGRHFFSPITYQPTAQTVRSGGQAIFSVVAAYHKPLFYQWRFNGERIDGETEPILIVENVSAVNAGNYSVSVTNGEETVISDSVKLIVTVPHDSMDSPRLLDPHGDHVFDSNIGATRELDEPFHAGNPGAASVWYQWKAPASGTVQIHTIGSSFDTLLAVYRRIDDARSDLQIVVADDDAVGVEFASRVEFNAVGGSNYLIAVDGFDGAEGKVAMTLDFDHTHIFGTAVQDGYLGFQVNQGGVGQHVVERSIDLGEWRWCADVGDGEEWFPVFDVDRTMVRAEFFRIASYEPFAAPHVQKIVAGRTKVA